MGVELLLCCQCGVLPLHVHVHCRHAQPVCGMIHISLLIVLTPSAIPVQRSACELEDGPVQITSVQEKDYLYGREYCDTV